MPKTRSRCRPSGPSVSRASGPGAGRPARASASASSTPASRTATRWSASSSGAVAISVDYDDNPVVEEDTEGDVCGHGTACAGIVRSIAPECSIYSVRVLGAGFTGSRPGAPRRASLRRRAGLRPHQHEPVDDEEAVRGAPPRPRRQRVLPAQHARRRRSQHAGRELPVEVLVGDLRRQPRGGRPADVLLQPEPAGRVLRARCRCGGGVAGRDEDQRVWQQLRDAAHRRASARSSSRSTPS